MKCPFHPTNNRPDLCADCLRAQGDPDVQAPPIELTQTCHGRLERYLIRMPNGVERVAFRPIGGPLQPKKAPSDAWGNIR